MLKGHSVREVENRHRPTGKLSGVLDKKES